MAIAGPTRGCSGVVRVAATASGTATTGSALGFLTDWSFNQQSEQIDASVMGSCAKSFVAGAVKTDCHIDGLWDGDNAIQTLLAAGSTVHLRIYPEGIASTANYYKTGAAGAVVLSAERKANGVDGVVGFSSDLAVNGLMTATAVP